MPQVTKAGKHLPSWVIRLALTILEKCDLQRPACSRCVKRNVPCTGYRDVNFRDQSARIIDKATRGHASDATPTIAGGGGGDRGHRSDSSSPPSGAESETSSDVAAILQSPVSNVSKHLYGDPGDVATNAFFLAFVNATHWAFFHEFFRDGNAAQRYPALNHAIQACGMAVLTFKRGDARGRAWSRAAYGRALHFVNPALGHPVKARQDDTLIAVMMLITFESLTLDGAGSTRSWRAHVHGASELLRLRGLAACTTPIGGNFYFDLRSQMILSCIWDCRPMPEFYREWSKLLTEKVPFVLKTEERAIAATFDFLDLRAEIAAGVGDADALYERAVAIDAVLVEWCEDAQQYPLWNYTVVPLGEVTASDAVWMGRVHQYTSPLGRGGWNMHRMLRIMLNQTKVNLCHLRGIEPRAIHILGEERRTIADDICAMAPHALGRVEGATHSLAYLNEAYQNAWPLFFAGRSVLAAKERLKRDQQDFIDREDHQLLDAIAYYEEQLNWILRQLRYIFNIAGVQWLAGPIATLERRADIYHDFQRLLNDPTNVFEHVPYLTAETAKPREIESSWQNLVTADSLK